MALKSTRLAALIVLTACGSSTAPHGATPHPGLSFLAGNQQTDTVASVLNQALVVQVVSNGAPATHVVVQFEGVSAADSANPYAGDWADPVPLTTNSPSSFVAESTNTSGQVSIGVAFGGRAGKAPLVVKVPQLGYVDTATFTITAGAAAGLRSGPADTAVYANATVTLHTSVVDRFGNPRSDAVTYTVLSGPAHVSGSQVTTTAIGRVAITGKASKAVDTAYISVVPPGTMAASLDGGGIATFNLDGSNYKVITTTLAGTVAWAPSGSSLVFDQTGSGGTSGGSASLYGTTAGGSVSVLDNSGGAIDAWPAYSRDGNWIYYIKISNGADLWRVRPDGSGDSAVTVTAGNPFQFPSPSPDGTQLVYVVPGAAYVEILNLSSGVATQLGSVLANSTAWAPNSNLIAYNAAGAISIIHSDGTGQTAITPNTYEFQIGWSPDGNWIVARNLSTRKIDLINVATPSLVLPLGYSVSMGSPTWH
jgi:hypothetical protein